MRFHQKTEASVRVRLLRAARSWKKLKIIRRRARRRIQQFSFDDLTLENSFATCLFFVSSANARKEKKYSNILVGFIQTVCLPSYKIT